MQGTRAKLAESSHTIRHNTKHLNRVAKKIHRYKET